MASFKILQESEYKDVNVLINAAGKHLSETLMPIQEYTKGRVGEKFLDTFIKTYKTTGSPIVINLDHKLAEKRLEDSEEVIKELEQIVEATAEHVSGYKLNFQSHLTFLIAKQLKFVLDVKEVYKAKTGVEPVVWLDQKLGDIPNTNFQAADILYKLGFDAVHVLPLT